MVVKIATGYFAKASQYSERGYALVSIALKQPWFLSNKLKVHRFDGFAPTEEILELKNNPDEYERRYRKDVLSKLDFNEVCNSLFSILKQECTDKIVLLCYEAPDKFCHRHIAAKWLSERFGITVREAETCENNGDSVLFSDAI